MHRPVHKDHEERLRDLRELCRSVKLILFDVDGVLTDGKILVHADGTESKQFDIKDGTAIVWAQRAGLRVGFLSARSSAATLQRASQLGVSIVHQGVGSKLETFESILVTEQLDSRDVAYMGDDVLDLPVLMRAGVSAAPADAAAEVRERVDMVTTRRGGDGAAREMIEAILRARGDWQGILEPYIADGQHA